MRSRPLPALGPTLEFLRILWELDHALQRRSKRMARDLGLTGPQRLALHIIGRFPGISAGELARTLALHPSTLSGILRRLEEGRWITRRSDPKDERRSLIGLTARGREVDAAHAHTIEAAVEEVARELPRPSLATAGTVLQALARRLEDGLQAD